MGPIRGRPTPWVARTTTGPNEAHLSPANSHRVSYAGSRWYHLERSPNVPPLEGYIRRGEPPIEDTQQERRKSSTPTLRPST